MGVKVKEFFIHEANFTQQKVPAKEMLFVWSLNCFSLHSVRCLPCLLAFVVSRLVARQFPTHEIFKAHFRGTSERT